jgi:hypothetical protein
MIAWRHPISMRQMKTSISTTRKKISTSASCKTGAEDELADAEQDVLEDAHDDDGVASAEEAELDEPRQRVEPATFGGPNNYLSAATAGHHAKHSRSEYALMDIIETVFDVLRSIPSC